MAKRKKSVGEHLKNLLSLKNITRLGQEAEDMHRRATALAFWAVILLTLASLLNLISAGIVNVFLALVLNGAVLIFGTRPKIVAAVGAAGIPTEDGKTKERIKEALDKYFNILFTFLLWGTLFLLVAGTVSFANHPMSIPIILVALLLLTWINMAWGIALKYAKKIIYLFALLMLILSFALLMPRAGYIKSCGFYPFDFFAISGSAQKVAEIDQLNQRNVDNRNKARLEMIEKKIKGGKIITELSDADQKFLQEQTRKRDKSKVPTVVKSLFAKKPTPKRTVKPKVIYSESIVFQAGQRKESVRSFNPGDDIELQIYGSVWKDISGGCKELLSGRYRKILQSGGKMFFKAKTPASIMIIQH